MRNFRLMVLIVTLFIVATITVARAYTFDGDFDPKNIFTYQAMEMESLGGNRVLATLKSNNEPKFVVACLMQAPRGIVILAYGYFDENKNLKHFMYQPDGHYKEMLPDETTTKNLIKRLKMLHNLSDA